MAPRAAILPARDSAASLLHVAMGLLRRDALSASTHFLQNELCVFSAQSPSFVSVLRTLPSSFSFPDASVNPHALGHGMCSWSSHFFQNTFCIFFWKCARWEALRPPAHPSCASPRHGAQGRLHKPVRDREPPRIIVNCVESTQLTMHQHRLPPRFADTVPHLFTSNTLPRDLSSPSTLPPATPSIRPTLYPVNFSSLVKVSPTNGRRTFAAPTFHFFGVPELTERNADQTNPTKAAPKPTPRVSGPSRLELTNAGHTDSDVEVSAVRA